MTLIRFILVFYVVLFHLRLCTLNLGLSYYQFQDVVCTSFFGPGVRDQKRLFVLEMDRSIKILLLGITIINSQPLLYVSKKNFDDNVDT